MPVQIEQKVIDPEAELSNVQRMFKKLAPMCSVAKRAAGIPQLAPQEKQLGILAHELKETLLCINLGRKGQHAIRDSQVKSGTRKSIVEYEALNNELRDERLQVAELDCLNYLAAKQIIDLFKAVPTETDELRMIENAGNRLRRMENKLDIAIKRFCVVNADNKQVREEIHRLLVERNDFNIQWNRVIGKLVKGKEYLMDIFEIASVAFADRDECCRKLEALKWKGLYQLNRDISEMQAYEGELNHLAKLEEFLRVKGSRRICEADEKEEIKRQEEIQRCEQQIASYDALLEEIFLPHTELEWRQVAEEFEEEWDFNHCIGVCDGKHISIDKPPESGSLFFNYKGFFSVILFAVVNANYEFMYVQTGTNGSINDASELLESTKFGQKLMNGDLNFPPSSPLPGTETDTPYVLLGDSAFTINKHIMKPYPLKNISREKRIFNYRLNRARRVAENAFGILAASFGVLQKPLSLDLSKVDAVVKACCALHNFLRKREPAYMSGKWLDKENISQGSIQKGEWRNCTDGLPSLKANLIKGNEEGYQVRNIFMNYFNAEGRVSFQDKMIDAVPINT